MQYINRYNRRCQIPPQASRNVRPDSERHSPKSDRIAVITVANSGIGYEAAKALAGAGVEVIIASPNERKGAEALAKIRSATSGADIAFEMQMGANYIGHFAWTMRLLPTVFDADNPRAVTVSSLAHRGGRINFEDL